VSKRYWPALLWGLSALTTPAGAGALLAPEGEGLLIVTTTFADANDAYDRRGRLIKTPSYRKFETQAYVEYGASAWLTVVGEASAMDFHGSQGQASLAAPNAPRYSGLGLGALAGRVPITEVEGVFVSLQAGLRAASSHNAQTFLDMKERQQFDARIQFFRGFRLMELDAFCDAQFGFRTQGQNGDEARIDLTAGLRPAPRFMVLAQSFTALSLSRSASGGVAAQKFQISGVYDIDATFSVQLGFVDAPMGVNSPAERGVISALWARF
jgi:protein XagA